MIATADVAKEAYKLLPSHYCHATVNTQFTIHNKIFTIKYWGSCCLRSFVSLPVFSNEIFFGFFPAYLMFVFFQSFVYLKH